MEKHMEHNTAAAGIQDGSYLKDTQEASKTKPVKNCCLFIMEFCMFKILKPTSLKKKKINSYVKKMF